MARVKGTPREPFLLRFKESEAVVSGSPKHVGPRLGSASNPKEEAPKPEPTKKSPWGD